MLLESTPTDCSFIVTIIYNMDFFLGKVMIPKDQTGNELTGNPKNYMGGYDGNHRRSKDTPDGEVMNIRTSDIEPDTGNAINCSLPVLK